MKNRIFVILVTICVIFTVFLGTGWTLGTMLTDKGPRIADVITTAPDGSDYTFWNLNAELAIDLVPLAWIPEVAILAGTGDYTYGMSTFGKLYHVTAILAEQQPVEMLELKIDLLSLASYNSGLTPYFVEVFKQGTGSNPAAAVKIGQVSFGDVQTFYIEAGWKVFFKTNYGSTVASLGYGLFVTTPELKYVPQTSEIWLSNETNIVMKYNKSPIFLVKSIS